MGQTFPSKQVSGRDEVASVARPPACGRAWVTLELVNSRRVPFTVLPSHLAFHDPRMRFLTEPREVTFRGGASCADFRARETAILMIEVAEDLQQEIVAPGVEIF